jgi:hypothetical protein
MRLCPSGGYDANDCFSHHVRDEERPAVDQADCIEARLGIGSSNSITYGSKNTLADPMRFNFPPPPHASATPALPLSTANVFNVETLACGSVTSESARMRVVISLVSTSTLT